LEGEDACVHHLPSVWLSPKAAGAVPAIAGARPKTRQTVCFTATLIMGGRYRPLPLHGNVYQDMPRNRILNH